MMRWAVGLLCRDFLRGGSVRLLAALLGLAMLGDGVALAAGQTGTTADTGQTKQALTRRGVGKVVQVEEVNGGKKIRGVVTKIDENSFDVTPKGSPPITLQYTEVARVRNGKSHTKAWVIFGVVWITIGLIAAKTV